MGRCRTRLKEVEMSGIFSSGQGYRYIPVATPSTEDITAREAAEREVEEIRKKILRGVIARIASSQLGVT